MMNGTARLAAQLAFKNRAAVEKSEACGCYYCGQIFPGKEVKEYTDAGMTALCPHCGVDSVLSSAQNVAVCEDTLKKSHDFWFRGTDLKKSNLG